MKNTDTITLGLGDLSIDGEDVGYLGGDVICTTKTESVDFTHGTHKTVVKRFVTTCARSIKASLAQLDVNQLKLALGIGDTHHNSGTDRICFGNKWNLDVLTNVKFVHTRDDGKKVTVFFPKAQVEPGESELKFSNDAVIVQDITITAVEDLSRTDCPLGFIQVGDNDDIQSWSAGEGGEGGNSGEGGNGGEDVTPVEVTDESVSGVAEESWYNYQLAHAYVWREPVPVVKSDDGTITYTENTDYVVDYEMGIITTQGCSSTTLTGGADIKVTYTYASNSEDADESESSGGEG